MEIITLPRSTQEDFIFEGTKLTEIDDKDMATTPNWWQLSVYKSTTGEIIFSSTFWRNYPRSLPPLYSVLVFQKLDDIFIHLVEGCYMPIVFANSLIAKTKRALDVLDNPVKPLDIPFMRSNDSVEEEEELEYYDPIFIEDVDGAEDAVYRQVYRVTGEERISSYI